MFFILYHYNTIKKIKKQKTEIIKHISLSNFFKIFDNQKGKKDPGKCIITLMKLILTSLIHVLIQLINTFLLDSIC